MRKLTAALCALLCLNASAQEDPNEKARPIVAEGKRLYRSEMASWCGTDIFLEAWKDRSKVGGYFSYTEGDAARCVFFSKGETPRVIGTITFDSTYDPKTASTDLAERDFTAVEKDLHDIRKAAPETINADTLFKTYSNTNLNLIPLVSGTEKKVYVLTGPQQNGVVIFGNDYLITFGEDNRIKEKRGLHRNIIPVYYGGKETEGKEVEGTMHSHLPETGDFITATDICTLMLYARFAKWNRHNVVSKNYLNIWDCKKNELVVITMEALKKIEEDQKKRRKASGQ